MRKIVLIIIMVLAVSSMGFSQKSKHKAIQYVPHVVIAKLNPSHRLFFDGFNKQDFQVETVKALFPNHRLEGVENGKLVDLSLIYELSLNVSANELSVIEGLLELEVFEYVEREVVNQIDFTPNDPELSKQGYLSQVNAYSAWDVSKGNANVKVGVVDSGTDMDHPDLQGEMYLNSADPINGIDDDNDGFVDNYHGWDFYENDNNPQIGDNAHGIHVAGIACAATDNSEGVSSVGYNSQFLAIRAGNGVVITHGYQGVVYAADMGCDVINCSWGSFGYTSFGKDAVDYATYNKSALVVAAAGNSGLERTYYPAGYESVLGVVSVKDTDEKSSFSNYGNWAGISAPGENIYSCVDDGLYNYNTGTSMASPIVAGAAALLKSVFPQLTPKQLAERLKTTSTDISSINPGLDHKIGYGRLNVNNAVSGSITDASVVFENRVVSNKGDDVFKAGDSLLISGTFTNYLAPSGNTVATISTSSPYISANNTSLNLGVMATLVQEDNFSHPFSFKIDPSTPINTWVTFTLTITDGTFSNTQLIDVLVNVDYLNIAINNIGTTVGSVGQFGYNARNQNQGLGVQYKNGSSQLFEGGLMIGTNSSNFIRVMDRVRNNSNGWDNDFAVIDNVHEILPPSIGQYELNGAFNDTNAQGDKIGLDVIQRGYAYTDPGHENYVVLEYTIINTTSDSITNLSAGLFADFDIADYDRNATYTDLTKVITYTISTDPGSPLFGVQLLTPGAFRSYALDNIPGGAGGVNINDGFTTSEKFQTLTSNRYGAGFTDISGNDVIQVTSMGSINLASGDSVTVAFSILAADSKGLLDNVADSAYFRYNGQLPNSINDLTMLDKSLRVFPNPSNGIVTLEVDANAYIGNWSFSVTDLSGKEMMSETIVTGRVYEIDIANFPTGIYLVDIQMPSGRSVKKLIKN